MFSDADSTPLGVGFVQPVQQGITDSVSERSMVCSSDAEGIVMQISIYNPKLHKAPRNRELSEEDRVTLDKC